MKDYRSRLYGKYTIRAEEPANSFDKNGAKKWAKSYRYYLRGWLPDNKESNIIDLACGSGRFLYFLNEIGYTDISGIDISPSQIQLVKQVTTRVQQIDLFEWSDGNEDRFDLVTGFDIIEHLQQQEVIQFLDICFSALKPGGKLILQTLNGDSPWVGSIKYADFSHENGFTPSSLDQLLRLTGFVDAEFREAGPVPNWRSVVSFCRFVIWRIMRIFLIFWNMVEIGNPGSGILTRSLIVSATKPVEVVDETG